MFQIPGSQTSRAMLTTPKAQRAVSVPVIQNVAASDPLLSHFCHCRPCPTAAITSIIQFLHGQNASHKQHNPHFMGIMGSLIPQEDIPSPCSHFQNPVLSTQIVINSLFDSCSQI